MVSSASSTVTDFPAWASRMAAARPFGPEPTTTASTRASAKLDDRALASGLDREVVVAVGRHDRIDLVVRAGQVVMEEQEPACPGGLGKANRVLDRGMAEGRPRGKL